MHYDNELEHISGLSNLKKDLSREAFIDVPTNELLIPIMDNFEIPNTSIAYKSSDFPKLETGAGIKFYVARKKPRNNINACQGDCKCGVGLKCGNQKYVYVKPKSLQRFSLDERLVSGQIYIDVESKYLIVKFDTQGVPWFNLDNYK